MMVVVVVVIVIVLVVAGEINRRYYQHKANKVKKFIDEYNLLLFAKRGFT